VIINEKPYTNPNNAQLASVLGINENFHVVVYGTDWCPDCRKSKAFLDNNKVNK